MLITIHVFMEGFSGQTNVSGRAMLAVTCLNAYCCVGQRSGGTGEGGGLEMNRAGF